MNKNFFTAIKNLKNDGCECVSELLLNYNVLMQDDQASSYSNYHQHMSEPHVIEFDESHSHNSVGSDR